MTKLTSSRKFVQWEPICSIRKDGQTDRHDEANSRFSQFTKASKNVKVSALVCVKTTN